MMCKSTLAVHRPGQLSALSARLLSDPFPKRATVSTEVFRFLRWPDVNISINIALLIAQIWQDVNARLKNTFSPLSIVPLARQLANSNAAQQGTPERRKWSNSWLACWWLQPLQQQ
jgi:hypothetical protein